MSSNGPLVLSYPTTPIPAKKRCHTNPHPSPAACPSVASSSGNTINDVSQPTTPSDVKTSPLKNFNRPRGKTLSSLDIFSIARDISGPTGLRGKLLEAFNDQKNQQSDILTSELQSRCNMAGDDDPNVSGLIAINPYEVNCQEADGVSAGGASEELVTGPTGDISDDSASDEDLKDLARHGLPSACIFVANLAATQTDDQLMKSLQSHFSKFGRLHVKIRRDSKSNPYSFCQFECDETARLALRDGRNAIIDPTGRRIRCEPAKVNRTLVLSKTDSNTFSECEARKILFGFGETESLEFARDGDTLPVRGAKEGKRCFVRFAYRQDAVDCYQYFRHHCAWTADWTSNFSAPNIIPRIQAVEIDPVSIFIGRLNPDLIEENELRTRFGKYGTIVECNLVNRASKNGIGRNAFAFVKYEAEEMASRALEEENNSQFLGKHIHVQKREIHKKPIRLAPPPPTGPRLGLLGANNQVSMDQVRRLGVSQPFPFSMEAVADLAARLSIQLAEQRDHSRGPSGAPMFSNQSVTSQVPYVYSPEQMASRHGSFQNNIPSMAFHQPFQPAYSRFHSPHQPITPEPSLSPRTAQAAVHSASTQDPNVFRQQAADDAYSGAFPPTLLPHHQFQSSHMMPNAAMMDHGNHRDSIVSIGPYDPVGIYGPQYGGYTTQPGYHIQPNNHHGGGS